MSRAIPSFRHLLPSGQLPARSPSSLQSLNPGLSLQRRLKKITVSRSAIRCNPLSYRSTIQSDTFKLPPVLSSSISPQSGNQSYSKMHLQSRNSSPSNHFPITLPEMNARASPTQRLLPITPSLTISNVLQQKMPLPYYKHFHASSSLPTNTFLRLAESITLPPISPVLFTIPLTTKIPSSDSLEKQSPVTPSAHSPFPTHKSTQARSIAHMHESLRAKNCRATAIAAATLCTPLSCASGNIHGSALLFHSSCRQGNDSPTRVHSPQNRSKLLLQIAADQPPLRSSIAQPQLRYGTVGLRAGFLRQASRHLGLVLIKRSRYARLQGTLLSLAKAPYGEIIWSFDIAGSVVEFIPKKKKILIKVINNLCRRRRILSLVAPDDESFLKWSKWLTRASKSVLEQHYSMERLIGEGAFARVVMGRDLNTGETIAIKLIEKGNAQPTERQYYEREATIMQSLSHPNVVRCHDVFDSRSQIRIVMEYMPGGTLRSIISDHEGPIPELVAKHIIRGILSGVHYLHANGIVHRDLKPDNCLLSSSAPPYGEVKISDFGLANFAQGNIRSHNNERDRLDGILTSAVGSPGFMAPEIFESGYSMAIDIWSCGVILYVMLSGGTLPFVGNSPSEIATHAQKGIIDFSSETLQHVTTPCKRFIRALLNFNACKRLTANQALLHPWLAPDS